MPTDKVLKIKAKRNNLYLWNNKKNEHLVRFFLFDINSLNFRFEAFENNITYNEEGDMFTDLYPVDDREAITDVPIKLKWEVGQMLPSRNSKLTVMTFEINDCTIEIRNVPIEWK